MPKLQEIATLREKRLLSTFLETISKIKNQAQLFEITRAIEANNYDALFRLLGLDQATFQDITDEIRDAYKQGGMTGLEQLGKIPDPSGIGSIALSFDMQQPEAVAWLQSTSSRFITEVVEDQKQMVRDRLAAGMERGDNPRQSTLDLIGRIDNATGKRKGGFIGLTSQQSGWVDDAREELRNLDSNYLSRELRDKRLDGVVKRAIKNNEPLTRDQIDRAIAQLQNRTLRYRGNVISRTESINALRAGQHQSMAQAADAGEVDRRDVKRTWDATGDARTREDHLFMDGQTARFGEPFVFPDLAQSRAMFPGDGSLGAPLKQIIQCRCAEDTEIDFFGDIRRVRGFK